MDAIGHSRYLPVVVYEKGQPKTLPTWPTAWKAAKDHNHPFWTPAFYAETWGTLDAAARAVEHLGRSARPARQSELNQPFFPWTLAGLLREQLRTCDIRGCDRHVGAHARAEDASRTREAEDSVRADHRCHDGDPCMGARGLDQDRGSSSACVGRKPIGACSSNIACSHSDRATTGRHRTRSGGGARCSLSIQVATIAATSAISAVWVS